MAGARMSYTSTAHNNAVQALLDAVGLADEDDIASPITYTVPPKGEGDAGHPASDSSELSDHVDYDDEDEEEDSEDKADAYQPEDDGDADQQPLSQATIIRNSSRKTSSSRTKTRTTKSSSANKTHICPASTCTHTTTTRTGMRKHIQSQHEMLLHNCPVPECERRAPARETIVRHLRQVHKMTDLPTWEKKTAGNGGRTKSEFRLEQVRVFREWWGEAVDVSFFLDGIDALEEGPENIADSKQIAGFEGEDSGKVAGTESSTKPDIIKTTSKRTTRASAKATNSAAYQPEPSLRPMADTDISASHKELLAFADRLEARPTEINFLRLLALLPKEAKGYEEFKQFLETHWMVSDYAAVSGAIVSTIRQFLTAHGVEGKDLVGTLFEAVRPLLG